ncbi:extracellular solute-binding protein [Aquisalimonas asiatica]|uniref:Multiple sugar transport system substrate-binding protein n=1 Tax=Aquisalimonas asiatica TaxID=406100 RepID=A0A1H8QV44_9GAMM|nr:extracellular solute-binding protein [Aquisalimonas asiatica]SEO57927.1 multiple sugar transport system substrate-binding protein [Aquisalimonas asiatica]
MTRKRRIIALLAAAVCGGALLWATTHWVMVPRGESDPAATTPPEALTPDLDGERLVFLSVNTDVAAARLLASWFHEDTGAVVKVREVAYDRMLDAVLDDVHAASPRYDVVEVWYPTIARLAEEGAIRELSALLDSYAEVIRPGDFLAPVFEAYAEYDGGVWAMPYDVDIQLLFHRQSLLARHGLEAPETWSEYRHAARVITEAERGDGVYGAATMGYPTAIINVSLFLNRLSAYDGRFLDAVGQPQLDSDEAVAALEEVVELLPYAMPSALETDYEVARDAFLAGRVALVEQWSDVGVSANDRRYSTIAGDWGVTPLPGVAKGEGAGATLNAGFSLAVSSVAPNPDAAEAFLLYASSPQIQKRLNLSGTGIDVGRRSVLDSAAFRERFPELADAVDAAFAGDVTRWPVLPETPELMAALSRHIARAMAGDVEPADALAEAQADWERLLDNDQSETVGEATR